MRLEQVLQQPLPFNIGARETTTNGSGSFSLREGWFSILAHRKSEALARGERLIAVYGGGNPHKGGEVWMDAFALGKELAQRGGVIMNGGYGGVMEASAAGARSVDGMTIGISCKNLLSREVNEYIELEWQVDRWDQRLLALVFLADAYAVMPGASGTLVELAMVIETQLKGFIPARPIVCLGQRWENVVASINGAGDMVTFTNSPAEMAEELMK